MDRKRLQTSSESPLLAAAFISSKETDGSSVMPSTSRCLRSWFCVEPSPRLVISSIVERTSALEGSNFRRSISSSTFSVAMGSFASQHNLETISKCFVTRNGGLPRFIRSKTCFAFTPSKPFDVAYKNFSVNCSRASTKNLKKIRTEKYDVAQSCQSLKAFPSAGLIPICSPLVLYPAMSSSRWNQHILFRAHPARAVSSSHCTSTGDGSSFLVS